MPKQYLLFAGPRFYPNGGWLDYRGDFTTKKKAMEAVHSFDAKIKEEGDGEHWYQIVNSKSGKIIEQCDGD